MNIISMIIVFLFLFLSLLLTLFIIRFKTGKREAEKYWNTSKVSKINKMGITEKVEILPLIDWSVSNNTLQKEPGVSYLIKTDTDTILFDTGFNRHREDPSPLEQNMKSLGIGINDFKTIVISHNHMDHVGGLKWQKIKSFSLSSHQVELKNKRVFTPVPMSYPGLDPVYSEDPIVISTGAALTGTIPNQLFFMGWTQEQALAINVNEKGIILIVGCGHQTIPKLISRCKALFNEPIYGIIGGLHFPVSDAPLKIMGIPIAKYVGTGKYPWKPVTKSEVLENIKYLKKEKIKIVALSSHDSCDLSISLFKDEFMNRFKPIIVGESIVV